MIFEIEQEDVGILLPAINEYYEHLGNTYIVNKMNSKYEKELNNIKKAMDRIMVLNTKLLELKK